MRLNSVHLLLITVIEYVDLTSMWKGAAQLQINIIDQKAQHRAMKDSIRMEHCRGEGDNNIINEFKLYTNKIH